MRLYKYPTDRILVKQTQSQEKASAVLQTPSKQAGSLQTFASSLPRLAHCLVKPLVQVVERFFVFFGSKSMLLARLYYAIFNSGFAYEQRAFLYGRRQFSASLKNPSRTMTLLRRNVHRIEKGLLMQPRRIPFALEYIEETVNCYCVAVKSNAIDATEVRWATDVLSEYFCISSAVQSLDELKETFTNCKTDFDHNSSRRMIPYQRDHSRRPNINIDELLKLASFRRSVRWFLPDKVPRDLIDQAIVVGGLAPSACNRQPYEFRIIDDPELVKEIAFLPMGTGGYASNIPCIVVIVGRQSNYSNERDRHLIYIDGSLAAMSFIFALECMGVSSCCINWPEIRKRDEKIAKQLKLERDERPIMCLAIGYPDPEGKVAYSAKKTLGIVRRYNFE